MAVELSGRVQASHARHRDVHHGHVDVVLEATAHRLDSVPHLGDDLQVGLRFEHHAETMPHHRVVVREQDPRLQRIHAALLDRHL